MCQLNYKYAQRSEIVWINESHLYTELCSSTTLIKQLSRYSNRTVICTVWIIKRLDNHESTVPLFLWYSCVFQTTKVEPFLFTVIVVTSNYRSFLWTSAIAIQHLICSSYTPCSIIHVNVISLRTGTATVAWTGWVYQVPSNIKSNENFL